MTAAAFQPKPLTVPLSPLIGREHEMAGLGAMLLRPGVRLVTLTGPGGVGKTRLARHLADSVRSAFPEGVWFVPLDAIRDEALLMPSIAQAVGVPDVGIDEVTSRIAERLGQGRHLFVLDNFEQIVDAAGIVGDLLAAVPNLKVIVTSRVPLQIDGEREYPVGPLSNPDGVSTDDALRFPAVRLFVERAAEVKPSFALTPKNAASIVAICQRLDGSPLAIELAAARIKVLTPDALLVRLRDQLQVLTSGSRNLPPRQKTMRDAIAWSYDLLDDELKLVFRALGVFSGGFTLEAAEAVERVLVSGAHAHESWRAQRRISMLDALSDLVDASLVRQLDDARFALFRTIREYAQGQLDESGELNTVARAHAEWVADLIGRTYPKLVGPDQQVWFDLLGTEHDNIRAALGFAIATSDAELAQPIAGHLWRFWWIRGHLSEGRRWLEQTLALPNSETAADHAYCLRGAATLAEDQGDYDVAVPLYDRALAAARAAGDEELEASVLDSLGNVAHDRGDYEAALRLHADALAIFQRIEHGRGIASALHNLGTVHFFQGYFDAAEEAYRQAADLLRELGDRRAVALVLGNLGAVNYNKGDAERSIQIQEESLAVFEEIGDDMGAGNILSNLGDTYRTLGDVVQAESYYFRALAMFERIGIKRLCAHVRANLGRIRLDQGDQGRAADAFIEALKGAWECGDLVRTSEVLASLGEQVNQLGDPLRSATLLAAAERLRTSRKLAFSEQQRADRERVIAAVRAAAPAEEFERAWRVGEEAELDEIVAGIDDVKWLAEAAGDRESDELTSRTGLSRRDLEVLRLFVAGKSHQEIATALDVTLPRATALVAQLFSRTGIEDRAGLTAFAFKHGLV